MFLITSSCTTDMATLLTAVLTAPILIVTFIVRASPTSSVSTSLIRWAIVEIFINGIIDTETIITTSIKILNSACRRRCSNSFQSIRHSTLVSYRCNSKSITSFISGFTKENVSWCYVLGFIFKCSSHHEVGLYQTALTFLSVVCHTARTSKFESEECIIINSPRCEWIVNKRCDKWIILW